MKSRVAIALSGGVDSMYMTWRYRHLDPLAITIDHGLRPTSRDEAVAVGKQMARWGVRHKIVSVTVPGDGLAFEENARNARYKALLDACQTASVSHLLVAHTWDDQMETFWMRLARNSTMFGLRGLREYSLFPMVTREPLTVVRPMLSVPKSSIIEECTREGITWFEDASNHDPQLTHRNQIRLVLASNESLAQDLAALHKQVVRANDLLDSKAREAEELIDFTPDYRNGLATIVSKGDIPSEVLTRYLFYQLGPFVSSKHFHWSYAKLEAFVEKGMQGTLLNLHFKRKGSEISVERTPAARQFREQTVSVSPHAWSLFDNRFWVWLDQPIELVVYNYSHWGSRVVSPLVATSDYNGAPAVVEDGCIVGFPTYLYKPNGIGSFRWHPKHNTYRSVAEPPFAPLSGF